MASRRRALDSLRSVAEIGATLRDARIRGHVDLNDVESGTKIRARYLRAMEDEEWDALPGPVYAKSFLRTYADYLGLDSRALVDEFKSQHELPTDHELRPVSPLPRERQRDRERWSRRPRAPSWVPVALVLVAVVAALYVVGSRSQKSGTTPTSAQASRPLKHHHQAPHHRTITAFVKPTTVKLELVPTAEVYVCLVNGSGTKLIPGQIFSPGQTIPTKTATKLLLTLGNASVRIKVNGASVKVAPSSTSIGFLLQPSGNSSLPPTQQPRCM